MWKGNGNKRSSWIQQAATNSSAFTARKHVSTNTSRQTDEAIAFSVPPTQRWHHTNRMIRAFEQRATLQDTPRSIDGTRALKRRFGRIILAPVTISYLEEGDLRDHLPL
jgi:hypothetical protein